MQKSNQLLDTLLEDLEQQRAFIALLMERDSDDLNRRSEEKSWSALECVAHLNGYAKWYIPKFSEAIHKAKAKGWNAEEHFKGTWIGQYCIKSVLPENRKKRLKSPAHHNHLGSALSREVLTELLEAIAQEEQLIKSAREVSLNKVKVAIEIMPWLKLRLGDFFPFLIKHQSRHLLQAMESVGRG